MNNKKISFLIADITCVGGIERVNSLLANALIVKNYDVEIISLYKTNNSINYPLIKDVTITYINDSAYSGKPGSFSRLLNHLFLIKKLNNYISKLDSDYFIVNSFPMAALILPSVIKHKCKYIVIEHVHAFYYKKATRLIRNIIYRFFDAIVALTKSDNDFYSSYFSNVYQIENPLSFESNIKSNCTAKKIIAVGRLEEQKGFDLLIDIFSKIEHSIKKDWSLDIYGQGSQRSFLQEKINTLGLNNSVILRGTVNNISEIYNTYSIFAFSSRYEGFGMVLVEAMNSGLACISFDCPTGPRDILLDGEFGVLIQNGDTKQYEKSLVNLMVDENLRVIFSNKAIKRSHDFSLPKIIEKWEELFISLKK